MTYFSRIIQGQQDAYEEADEMTPCIPLKIKAISETYFVHIVKAHKKLLNYMRVDRFMRYVS